MKNLAFVTLFVSLVFAMACGGGSTKPSDSLTEKVEEAIASINKKLPFERGSYVEVSVAMGMEIKRTIYFDKWGEWTATEHKMEMSMMGYTHVSHEIEIIKGNTHWKLDMVKKTGQQWEADGFTGDEMAASIEAAKVAGQMAKDMKIEELGTVEHLGYVCKKTHVIYEKMNMDATTVAYENLTMKMVGKVNGMEVKNEIISIDLTPPPASIFEVPEGFEIEKL
jgi:hypothetical protein